MSNNVNLAKDSKEVLKVHTDMMKLHYKAMGCHCEVMGMMSENMLSACLGQQPMFGTLHFREVLHRWGMTNEKGEPII
jgi:hypothetical protein